MRREIGLALLIVTDFFLLVSTFNKSNYPDLEITIEKAVETEYDYIYDLRVKNEGESALTNVNVELFYLKAKQSGQIASPIFKDKFHVRHLLGIGSGESDVFQVIVPKDLMGVESKDSISESLKVNVEGIVWHTIIPMGYKLSAYPLR